MIADPFLRERGGADGLVEGYYLLRSAGRVDIPIRIWFGAPLDPDTGELLDRSPRWQVRVYGIDASDPEYPPLIYGRPMEKIEDVWPKCARWPTSEADYRYRVERAEWAEQYDAADPFGTKSGKVDHMTAPLPFME